MLDKIRDNFTESIQTAIAASEEVATPIEQASMIMVQCLLNGNKILVCGSGNSITNAQLFSSYLINSYETERPSFPAISLTNDNTTLLAIAKTGNVDDFFSAQVRALGNNADILLAISPSGNDTNVLKAVQTAISRDMSIIALTGFDGGSLAGLLGDSDVEIRIPSARDSRIQEVHQFIVHCLCDLIDSTIFPQGEQ